MAIRIKVPYTRFTAPATVVLTRDEFELCKRVTHAEAKHIVRRKKKQLWVAFWSERRWMYYYTRICLWGVIVVGVFLLNFLGELLSWRWPTDLPDEYYYLAFAVWMAFAMVGAASTTTNLTVRSYGQMVDVTLQRYRREIELARTARDYEEYRNRE